jgi:hypothetical protein
LDIGLYGYPWIWIDLDMDWIDLQMDWIRTVSISSGYPYPNGYPLLKIETLSQVKESLFLRV